jgi:ferrous iron transport protein B
MSQPIIGLVGNPNCGKTTLFNALTGSNQHVGNWAGVTVERKEGEYRSQGQQITVVDLPGVYSVDAEDTTTGLDELVARDYLLSGEANAIVNIVDASNLERNLYLSTQILEMGVPMLIALNMIDLAEKRNIRIDVEQLSQRLGCPVISLCAYAGKGIAQLQEAVDLALSNPEIPHNYVIYPPEIEQALGDLTPLLENQALANPANVRWFGLNLLQYDDRHLASLGQELLQKIGEHRQHIQEDLGEDIDLLIADSRYTWIRQIMQGAVERNDLLQKTISDRLDRIVLNRWLGIPIFLAVMYLMFMVSINIGGAFIDFFDISVGTIFVDGTEHLLTKINASGWLIGLLANGVGGGIQTTSTFIPQIGFLFLFLAILEDSGYLARAAFVMDRLMRFVGLPGKSFVPMMVGFGCNIPGIMATRTLENRRDRLMTILMNPFMSCGARLPVYALFCAAFFPTNGQNIVFLLYIVGILAAIFTGLVMKRTLFRGEAAPFVMELPPYHIPTLRGITIRAWERLRAFITKAGKMIVIVVIILGLINSVGIDGSFGKKDSQDSILSHFSRAITPVFSPMGEQDNWPATVGLFTGIFAKEVMVGTMDSLYTALGEQSAGAADKPPAEFDFWAGMGKAVNSIPENLVKLADQAVDPLGLSILGSTDNLETAAAEQEVNSTTFGQMASRFGSPAAAIAYLLFVLLYFPCVSATAAIYRETNLGWTIFVACWTTGLGYWVAVFYYQLMTMNQHPATAIAWLTGLSLFMLGTLVGLRRFSAHRRIQAKSQQATQLN